MEINPYEVIARNEPIMRLGLIYSGFLTFWYNNTLLCLKKKGGEGDPKELFIHVGYSD